MCDNANANATVVPKKVGDRESDHLSRTLKSLVKCFIRESSFKVNDIGKASGSACLNHLDDDSLSPREQQIFEYCTRILGSPSYTIPLVVRENKSSIKALRFSNLFTKLQSQSILSRRWSILYFLLSLSDQSTFRETIGPIEQTFASRGLVDISKKNYSNDPDNHFMPNVPFLSNTSSTKIKSATIGEKLFSGDALSPEAILRKHSAGLNTKYEISEVLLLRDVVYVFQGIDGQFIKFNTESDSYIVDPKVGVPRPTRDLITKLSELGLLYRRVDSFVKTRVNDSSIGLVGQAFCSALQRELTEYFKLMAVLEAHITKQLENQHFIAQGLSLKRLLVWTQESLAKLRLMSVLVNGCQDQRGGALVSIIYKHTNHGDPFNQKFINNMLEEVSRPFYEMLQRWIYEGELEDPFEEFFVACDVNVEEEDLWQLKYSIRSHMQPSFISTSLAKKIFSIGKSLNFIRYSCHDNDWVTTQRKATGSDKLFRYGDIIALEHSIDATYTATSKRLLNILYLKYRLMEHFTALKRYLLLGQGDFIQYLMGQLGPGLSKAANTLYRHNLTGTLEAAVRASNAQYDDPDILRRLDVRLLEVSSGDCGWDVFSLDYHVDSPINTIFTPQAMHQYLKLFNFLWRLKRVEYCLSDAWRRQTTGARNLNQIEELKKDINTSRTVCNEMIHFVYQLQYYILFEVVECSWDELVTDIEKKSGDLDSLIEAHNSYLNNVTSKSFLGTSNNQNYLSRLSKIIAYILQYLNALEELYLFAAREMMRRDKFRYESEERKSRYSEFKENISEQQDLKTNLRPIQQQLIEVSGNFKNELMSLLTALAHHHDTDLRFLSVRLDFNEFYHNLAEKEGYKGKKL
ncbi:hypothetical protein G9A89_006992 [Geosiphon pyriformis]|nr:hypothetical protein G9A89_006992 [Geosiphon pyriformis]